jgi:hypothetical protein
LAFGCSLVSLFVNIVLFVAQAGCVSVYDWISYYLLQSLAPTAWRGPNFEKAANISGGPILQKAFITLHT